jgi:hypothetical protein
MEPFKTPSPSSFYSISRSLDAMGAKLKSAWALLEEKDGTKKAVLNIICFILN